MLKFDNPPAHVFTNYLPKLLNPLPVVYGFNPQNGNFVIAGNEYIGNLIIQPLHSRWKMSARHGESRKMWLDTLFVDKHQKLGLISLTQSVGYDLSHVFQRLRRKKIGFCGVWLCLSGHNRSYDKFAKFPFMVNVTSYYWATEIDCLIAERKLRDIRLKPWEQLNGK